jgi:hypothetical protein
VRPSLFLSITNGWDRLVSLTSSLFPTFFPTTAPHRTAPTGPRRGAARGLDGRAAELARTPSFRTHPWLSPGDSARGSFPFCPRPVTLKELGQPLVVGHVAAPASPLIGMPRAPIQPCISLTGTLKGTPRP